MDIANLLLDNNVSSNNFPKFPSGFPNLENFASLNFSGFKKAKLTDKFEVYVGDPGNDDPTNEALVKEFFEGIYFRDVDGDGKADFEKDIPDIKLANIKLFASTDGAYLRTQHHKLKGKVNDDEFAVFVELPSGDSFSGLFCAVIAGEGQARNTASFLFSDWAPLTDNVFELKDFQLKKLLESLYSRPSFLDYVWQVVVSVVLQPILEIAKLGAGVFTGIGNLFGLLRIDESVYNPDSKGYSNISIVQILEKLLKRNSKGIEELFEYLTSVKIPPKVKEILDKLTAFSNSIILVIVEIIEDISQFVVGLICGIWNSLIDLISGIFDLIGLIFKLIIEITNTAIHAEYYWNVLLEYADNFTQYIEKIDWKQVIVHGIIKAKEISAATANIPLAILKNIASINFGEFGYYVGYILFEIVQLFFPILEIAKIGKLGKLTKLDNIIEGLDIFGDAKKVSKKSFDITDFSGGKFKTTFDTIIEAFEYFIGKLRAGTASFKKWLDDIFEAIKRWIDDLLGFNKTSEEVTELFRRGKSTTSKGEILFRRSELLQFSKKLEKKYSQLNLKVNIVTPNSQVNRIRLKRWDQQNVLGSFSSGPPPVIHVRQRCTHLTMQHEIWHLEDYARLGPIEYKKLPNWKHEESVWLKILKNKDKWSKDELIDSYNYYLKEVNKAGQNPIISDEMIKLIN